MTERKLKLCSDYELTKDTAYLSLTGEVWDVFCEIFRENLPWDIKTALYMLCTAQLGGPVFEGLWKGSIYLFSACW